MLSRLSLLAAVLALSYIARPVSSLDAPLAGTRLTVLRNGVRLVVHEKHSAPLVAIDLWVRAGSGHELKGEEGAAHFLEHLLFKGTAKRGPGEIDDAFEDLGAQLAASTTRDGAHFYTTVAKQHLERALDVLQDMARNPALAPGEMERERPVILDELARDLNDWKRQAVDSSRASAFAGHPYGRPVLADAASIKTASREAVVGFHRRLYRPDNCTLVLVGDLTEETAVAAAEKTFGDWPRPSTSLTEPATPAASKPARAEQTCGKSALAVGFRTDPVSDSEPALDVLATLLGDPRTGRLAPKLLPIGADVELGADYAPLRTAGIFAIYAAGPPEKLPRIAAAIDGEIRLLCREILSPGDLAFAKGRTLGGYLYDSETCAGQARLLGEAEMRGSYEDAVTYPARLRKLTAADLQGAAKAVFDPDRRFEVTLK